MKDPKQKKQLLLLLVLFVVLGFTLYYSYTAAISSSAPGSATIKSAQGASTAEVKTLSLKRNPRRSGGAKEVSIQEIDPTIHLEKLAQFHPETPLNARNMFSLEAQPSSQPPNPPGVGSGTRGDASDSVSGGSRAAVPPPVVINLKYFGFTLDPVEKQRQGFFAEGDEVFLASEGDLVANRYRVVRIGESIAEIEEVSSRTRRQISLVVQ